MRCDDLATNQATMSLLKLVMAPAILVMGCESVDGGTPVVVGSRRSVWRSKIDDRCLDYAMTV